VLILDLTRSIRAIWQENTRCQAMDENSGTYLQDKRYPFTGWIL